MHERNDPWQECMGKNHATVANRFSACSTANTLFCFQCEDCVVHLPSFQWRRRSWCNLKSSGDYVMYQMITCCTSFPNPYKMMKCSSPILIFWTSVTEIAFQIIFGYIAFSLIVLYIYIYIYICNSLHVFSFACLTMET